MYTPFLYIRRLIKMAMKGLIFDMDGTIVDNMMVHHRAWQDTFSKLGIEMTISEVMEKVHGVNHEILERLFGDQFTPGQRQEISASKEKNYRQIYKDQLILMPGLAELLQECQSAGIPMAIASAAPPENVEFVVENLSIRHYFDAIYHAANVTHGKPDPEVFLLAAAKLNVDPSECIIFEDSLTGAEAARNAGAKTIIVTTTHDITEFDIYDHIVRFVPDFRKISLAYLLTI